MDVSEKPVPGPSRFDLDRCIHCGLCLNACPTYLELGLEADSPRGRVYQMTRVANGAPVTPSYIEHIGLCLACRGCESACPSGVPYGRMVEDARAVIEAQTERGWAARKLRGFVFGRLFGSRGLMTLAGAALYLFETTGLRALVSALVHMKLLGGFGALIHLLPSAEAPFFFSKIGRTFPAEGERRRRVTFLTGCVANVCFARLNEATVRVLQKNGCEVAIPKDQGCCGALHLHSGEREEARVLARRNIDAFLAEPCDAIISNAAGCGSTLKEYGRLLEDDPGYAARAAQFSSMVKDVTEFLASLGLNPAMGAVEATVCYQDSCHLAHGQQVRGAPRRLLEAVPGLSFREMAQPDVCCGSAGVYNVVRNEMSMRILARKMESVNATGAGIVATANPGCMLQLEVGVRLHGKGQKVLHVVEVLDRAYASRTEAVSLPEDSGVNAMPEPRHQDGGVQADREPPRDAPGVSSQPDGGPRSARRRRGGSRNARRRRSGPRAV